MASTTASDVPQPQSSCANCGVRTNDLACSFCRDAPSYGGGDATTYYCGIHCSMYHAHLHQNDCSASQVRRILYREGDIAKLIFQRCCQRFSKISIVGAEKTGNDITVYQTSDTDKQCLPSLASIFPNDEDKDAALACMSSDAAIPFLRALLEQMLSGLLLHLARVDYTIKSPLRRIIMITPEGTPLDNTLLPLSILQLTLKNNEVYAINITSAQHGFPNDEDAVVPWDVYHASRIESVRQIEILSSLADERLEDERLAEEQAQNEDKQQMEGENDADALSSGTNKEQEYEIIDPVLEAIKTWPRPNVPIQYVLTGGWRWGAEEEYLVRRGQLLDFIEHSLDKFYSY